MSINDLIFGYEENLRDFSFEDVDSRPITVRLPSDDVAFAQAAANYYRTNRSSFLQDLLRVALQDFFWKLPVDSRMSICSAADELWKKEVSVSGRDIDWLSLARAEERQKQQEASE